MQLRILAVGAIVFAATLPAVADPPAPPQGDGEQRELNDRKIESAGIRKLTGKHLILVTDVPSSPEIDRLPAVFDAAVPLWAEYFGVDLKKTERWQARGYLMGERRRFESLGLLPPGHADFQNGISMGAEFWWLDQPTAYYRRHLMLHEGTHVFMVSFLGGCGPGWYMEGIAELFATHRLDEQSGELSMRIMPESREEVPMLGRIKLIRDAVAAEHILTLPEVMKLDNREQLGNEAYAWCWAAAKLLDTHPRYRQRFHSLYESVLDPQFNDRFRHVFENDWQNLNAEWQAYIAALDHGYDFDRMAVDFRSGEPASAGSARATIASDQGWQSTGIRLETGHAYKVTAAGRYQIATEKTEAGVKPWPCEPGGVTVEYHDGHPLGMLLGAVIPAAEFPPTAPMTFAHPIAIGLEATIKPAASGTLYLRVNDSAANVEDNRGSLSVRVQQAASEGK